VFRHELLDSNIEEVLGRAFVRVLIVISSFRRVWRLFISVIALVPVALPVNSQWLRFEDSIDLSDIVEHRLALSHGVRIRRLCPRLNPRVDDRVCDF